MTDEPLRCLVVEAGDWDEDPSIVVITDPLPSCPGARLIGSLQYGQIIAWRMDGDAAIRRYGELLEHRDTCKSGVTTLPYDEEEDVRKYLRQAIQAVLQIPFGGELISWPEQ